MTFFHAKEFQVNAIDQADFRKGEQQPQNEPLKVPSREGLIESEKNKNYKTKTEQNLCLKETFK